MHDQVVCVAGVTVLGLLEQAYFSLQVIYARRKYSVSPPLTSGPPEFERIFRAQANCSEYFPLFIASLWVAGLFFSQGMPGDKVVKATFEFALTILLSHYLSFVSIPDPASATALLGLLYLIGRYYYFWGYTESALGRLKPLYFAAKVQWLLIILGAVGVLCSMSRLYLGLDLVRLLTWGLM